MVVKMGEKARYTKLLRCRETEFEIENREVYKFLDEMLRKEKFYVASVEKEEFDFRTYTYKMIPNNLEAESVPTKYEVDRDAFYAALKVKAWINYVTKR